MAETLMAARGLPYEVDKKRHYLKAGDPVDPAAFPEKGRLKRLRNKGSIVAVASGQEAATSYRLSLTGKPVDECKFTLRITPSPFPLPQGGED